MSSSFSDASRSKRQVIASSPTDHPSDFRVEFLLEVRRVGHDDGLQSDGDLEERATVLADVLELEGVQILATLMLSSRPSGRLRSSEAIRTGCAERR